MTTEEDEKASPKEEAVWPHAPYGYHMGRIKAYEALLEPIPPKKTEAEDLRERFFKNLAAEAEELEKREREQGNTLRRGRGRERTLER